MRSKRAAASPAAAGGPAAKRGKAGAGSSGGSAAAAKSKSGGGNGGGQGGAAGTPRAGKRTAAGKRAAVSSRKLYVIRCERATEVKEWDDETFVDCYGDEVDGPTDEVEGCAEAEDGVSYFSKAGAVVVFQSLEAANRQAALVARDMQRHCPEDWRPKDGSEDGSEEDSEEGSGGKGAEDAEAEAAGAPCKVLPGGRHQYKGTGFFYVDPYFKNKLENLVRSKTIVEVAPAVLAG